MLPLMNIAREAKQFVQKHADALTLSIASGFVFLWTTFRFLTNGANFDVVGQIGLAGQWAHGLHGGAQLGATNYLLKMPIYALANSLSVISPHLRLYLLAWVFNLITFWALFWLGKKYLRLAGVRQALYWRLAVVWLSIIAGRVFWMDYANSRNLEVVGGVVVLYLGLKLLDSWSWKRFWALLLLSGVVFFADPLQMYIMGSSLVINSLGSWFNHTRQRRFTQAQSSGAVMGAMVGAVLFAKGATWLASHILPVSFLAAPEKQLVLSTEGVWRSLLGIVRASARILDLDIYTKAFGVVSLRHAVAWMLFWSVVWVILRSARKLATKEASLLVLVLCLSYALYVVSGHALQIGTERYLVMVPIVLALLFGLAGDAPKRSQRGFLLNIWAIGVVISLCLLTGALVRAWPSRFSVDKPMFALADYATRSPANIVISGRQYVLPANYYAGYGEKIAPVICTNEAKVKLSNLFYDRSSWRGLDRPSNTIAIVVQPGGIYSEQYVCRSNDILKQLGPPERRLEEAEVGTILFYQGSVRLKNQLSE